MRHTNIEETLYNENVVTKLKRLEEPMKNNTAYQF